MPQISAGDVQQIFQSFGIQPSQEQISAFAGMDSIDSLPLISDYALAVNSESKRQASDPLNSYIKMAGDFTTKMYSQAETMYGQLQDLLSQAPKLFGDLTPDQVNDYLAPLNTEFQKADAITQGGAARRGITGSSIESQDRILAENQFKENVLQTGLNVGMTQQNNKASSIAQRIQQLMSSGGQAFGLEGQATGQKSAQDLSQSNLLASLPYFLQQSDQAAVANFKARNPKKGFFQKFNEITGAINTGLNTAKNVVSTGASMFGATPGPAASAPASASTPNYSQAFASSSGGVPFSPTGAPIAADPAAAALI